MTGASPRREHANWRGVDYLPAQADWWNCLVLGLAKALIMSIIVLLLAKEFKGRRNIVEARVSGSALALLQEDMCQTLVCFIGEMRIRWPRIANCFLMGFSFMLRRSLWFYFPYLRPAVIGSHHFYDIISDICLKKREQTSWSKLAMGLNA